MIPLAGLIDLAAERARLAKERARAAGEAEKVAKKLANPDFVARAKEEVVEENRERLAAAQAEIARLEAALARISEGRPGLCPGPARGQWTPGPLLRHLF